MNGLILREGADGYAVLATLLAGQRNRRNRDQRRAALRGGGGHFSLL